MVGCYAIAIDVGEPERKKAPQLNLCAFKCALAAMLRVDSVDSHGTATQTVIGAVRAKTVLKKTKTVVAVAVAWAVVVAVRGPKVVRVVVIVATAYDTVRGRFCRPDC